MTTAPAILYRDDRYLVVDKPPGLVVHRGWARDRVVVQTLVRNAIDAWVYPVHRLDRGLIRRRAIARFSADLMAERYLEVYRSVLRERTDRVAVEHSRDGSQPARVGVDGRDSDARSRRTELVAVGTRAPGRSRRNGADREVGHGAS